LGWSSYSKTGSHPEPHPVTYHTAVRPLTDDEYTLLKEDIAKRGIISPIIKDAAGNIVDGYHRNKIAEELGLTDIPIKQVEGTEAELQAMAIALNVARRQLNAEDRRELVTKLRAEGQSTRQIAEALGVDPKTVRNDLNDAAEATGENSPVDRVTGKDGKSRPARMPAKAKAKTPEPVEPPPHADEPQAEPSEANEPSGSTPADGADHAPPTGHTSIRPLIEIKVLARNEWQTKALENEPTNPEEATMRYDALSWETGEIAKRWHELETAEGKVLEDAKRFFPNGRGWKTWVNSHKTCEASSRATNTALWHVGYNRDCGPQNTMTRFHRWFGELLRSDDSDARIDQVIAAVSRLMGEHVTAELPMDKLLTERWPSMSGSEKAGVHSFLAAEMAKFETVNRPAAPAIS
jgi:transposase-like protein